MEKVTLARHRWADYVVNYENKRYVWAGARGNIVSKKDVPMEVYEWLASSFSTMSMSGPVGSIGTGTFSIPKYSVIRK